MVWIMTRGEGVANDLATCTAHAACSWSTIGPMTGPASGSRTATRSRCTCHTPGSAIASLAPRTSHGCARSDNGTLPVGSANLRQPTQGSGDPFRNMVDLFSSKSHPLAYDHNGDNHTECDQ